MMEAFQNAHSQMLRVYVPLMNATNFRKRHVRRRWRLKSILNKIDYGRRVLKIGAGEPWVDDLLNCLGYEVGILDRYEGSGRRPQEFVRYSARNVHSCRSLAIASRMPCSFQPHLSTAFTHIVLEHTPGDLFARRNERK